MSDIWDALAATTLARLGDPIVYRPNGGAALVPAILGYVDFGDDTINFGESSGTVPGPTLEVRVVDVATPTRADRITIPRIAAIFAPESWPLSSDGRHYRMTLKRVLA